MYENYINQILSAWDLKASQIKGDIEDKWLIYIRCVVSYHMFQKMNINDKSLSKIFELDFDVYKKQMNYFKLKQLKKRDTFRGYKYGKDNDTK